MRKYFMIIVVVFFAEMAWAQDITAVSLKSIATSNTNYIGLEVVSFGTIVDRELECVDLLNNAYKIRKLIVENEGYRGELFFKKALDVEAVAEGEEIAFTMDLAGVFGQTLFFDSGYRTIETMILKGKYSKAELEIKTRELPSTIDINEYFEKRYRYGNTPVSIIGPIAYYEATNSFGIDSFDVLIEGGNGTIRGVFLAKDWLHDEDQLSALKRIRVGTKVKVKGVFTNESSSYSAMLIGKIEIVE